MNKLVPFLFLSLLCPAYAAAQTPYVAADRTAATAQRLAFEQGSARTAALALGAQAEANSLTQALLAAQEEGNDALVSLTAARLNDVLLNFMWSDNPELKTCAVLALSNNLQKNLTDPVRRPRILRSLQGFVESQRAFCAQEACHATALAALTLVEQGAAPLPQNRLQATAQEQLQALGALLSSPFGNEENAAALSAYWFAAAARAAGPAGVLQLARSVIPYGTPHPFTSYASGNYLIQEQAVRALAVPAKQDKDCYEFLKSLAFSAANPVTYVQANIALGYIAEGEDLKAVRKNLQNIRNNETLISPLAPDNALMQRIRRQALAAEARDAAVAEALYPQEISFVAQTQDLVNRIFFADNVEDLVVNASTFGLGKLGKIKEFPKLFRFLSKSKKTAGALPTAEKLAQAQKTLLQQKVAEELKLLPPASHTPPAPRTAAAKPVAPQVRQPSAAVPARSPAAPAQPVTPDKPLTLPDFPPVESAPLAKADQPLSGYQALSARRRAAFEKMTEDEIKVYRRQMRVYANRLDVQEQNLRRGAQKTLTREGVPPQRFSQGAPDEYRALKKNLQLQEFTLNEMSRADLYLSKHYPAEPFSLTQRELANPSARKTLHQEYVWRLERLQTQEKNLLAQLRAQEGVSDKLWLTQLGDTGEAQLNAALSELQEKIEQTRRRLSMIETYQFAPKAATRAEASLVKDRVQVDAFLKEIMESDAQIMRLRKELSNPSVLTPQARAELSAALKARQQALYDEFAAGKRAFESSGAL